MRGNSDILNFYEHDRKISAVCGDIDGILFAQPSKMFNFSTLEGENLNTMLLRGSIQIQNKSLDTKPFVELPGVVVCMINGNDNDFYILRYIPNTSRISRNFYFDVLERETGRIIQSTNLPRAVSYLYMLKDNAICAWSESFQLFSSDRGKTWSELPHTIRGYAYGCGSGDSMFFLRGGVLSEVEGKAVRQGRLEQKIIVQGDSTASSLVQDEDSGYFYTIVKQNDNFFIHQFFGKEEIFLCDDSEDPGHGLVELEYAKNGQFYASASFMKHPFHMANYLIVTNGKSLLRSRNYLDSPKLIGHVDNWIFFNARAGLQGYVFFYVNINELFTDS